MRLLFAVVLAACPVFAAELDFGDAGRSATAAWPRPDPDELKRRLEGGDAAAVSQWLRDYDGQPALRAFVEQHPGSKGVGPALLLLADGSFDRSDLEAAQRMYERLTTEPAWAAYADLARYKLGWIHINRASGPTSKKENLAALDLFTLVVRSPLATPRLREEALTDLVFPYTEVKPPEGALAFFEGLAPSREALVSALSRLGNRYFIKQQKKPALAVYRRLIELDPISERRADWDERVADLTSPGSRHAPKR